MRADNKYKLYIYISIYISLYRYIYIYCEAFKVIISLAKKEKKIVEGSLRVLNSLLLLLLGESRNLLALKQNKTRKRD